MTKNTHPLITELQTFHKEFQARAKVALKEEFKEFFKKFPEIESCKWTQYTPYFNDGEPCEFGVGELTVYARFEEIGTVQNPKKKVVGNLEADVIKLLEGPREYSDNDVCSAINDACYDWKTRSHTRTKTELEQALIESVRKLSALTIGLGDMLKDIFGDHVEVTANRGGFDISDYDHE